MTEPSTTSPDPSAAPVLRALGILEARLMAAVGPEEDLDYQGQRTARTTQVISQIAFGIAMLLTPVVFFLIGSLVLSMGVITDRMGVMAENVAGMRGNFDETTARMDDIDRSVAHMTHNVAFIPGMERDMLRMRHDFSAMTGTMNGLSPNMQQIDQALAGMDFDMAQMNNVFGHLNLNVFSMGRDVNTMSTPLRMFPFFGN
jgi:hypothetical protein